MKNDVWIIILFLAIIAGVALSAASAADAATRCVFVGQSYVCTADGGRVATGVCIETTRGMKCL
jgi:hypothetical protein